LNGVTYTLSELARRVGGELDGDGGIPIEGVGSIRDAGPGQITFLAKSSYAADLRSTRASAVVIGRDAECAIPAIRCDNPYLTFVGILELFAQGRAPTFDPGVHGTASVDATAVLEEGSTIGACCGVGAGSRIGKRTVLMHGTCVGRNAIIGSDCVIHANVTIEDDTVVGDRVILHPGVVLGADGFGFVPDGRVQRKIPQIGRVVIESDVEIGANSAVDRATFGETRICQGVKIDNLCQVGHNTIVGRNTVIAGQSAIAGSVVVGENVILAGQVGVAGHLSIGDGVIAGAQTGIFKSVKPGTTVFGSPAEEHMLTKRIVLSLKRLPGLLRRVKELEERTNARKKDGE
jgi:UDP-3-O-[3-hydroxymyristoyl] glucosamine N-acyltransferase